MNRILARQLRKSGLSLGQIPDSAEKWKTFLDQVNRFYHESDKRIYYLDNTLTVSLQEMDISISRLKLAQAEMIQSSKLASLGTLAAGIAHEINNAINYVNSSVVALERILKADPNLSQNSVVSSLLDMMRDGIKLVLDIVLSLSDYTGLNQAQWQDTSLYKSSQSVLRIIKSKMEHRTVINQIPHDLVIFINMISLGQILMNLISNAIDASSAEGKIVLSADDNGEDIVFSVKDDGVGMSEEVRSRVFEPFFTTKTDLQKGSGLGMFIVKREVDLRGGRIEIGSGTGQGAEVRIWFPKKFQTSDPLVKIKAVA